MEPTFELWEKYSVILWGFREDEKKRAVLKIRLISLNPSSYIVFTFCPTQPFVNSINPVKYLKFLNHQSTSQNWNGVAQIDKVALNNVLVSNIPYI